MRLRRLRLKNYRQFKDVELYFDTTGKDHDIHVIVGRNGTGKTNLLNAINWCFYGDEPHLSTVSGQLPIFNLAEEKDSNEADPELRVEIQMCENFNREFIFLRRNHGEPQVLIKGNSGYTSYGVSVFNRQVYRIVPQEVRSFFFFDGEHLDNYFEQFSEVRDQIGFLSRVNVLDIVEDRLRQITKEIGRNVKDLDPEIRKIIEQRHHLQEKIKELKENLASKRKEKVNLEKEIEEIERFLRGLPDAELYQKQLQHLRARKTELSRDFDKFLLEKRQKLIRLAKYAYLWEALNKAIEVVKMKRKQKELPPRLDISLLEETLKQGFCSLCGHKLDMKTKNKIENLMREVEVSSQKGYRLLALENSLITLKKEAKYLYEKVNEINLKLSTIEREIHNILMEEREINEILKNHNVEMIRENQRRLNELRRKKDEVMRDIGSIERQIEELNNTDRSLENRYSLLAKQQSEASRELFVYEKFLKSLEVVGIVREEVMEDIREHIEKATNEVFFNLIWKKESFNKVIIHDDYSVELINAYGENCIGSLSAAERELLALSFTIALHRISGFEAPLIIDTPLARVSDEHRRTFSRSLLELSRSKQIILLLTPAEFSEEVREEISPYVASLYKLEMSPDEKETYVKEEAIF